MRADSSCRGGMDRVLATSGMNKRAPPPSSARSFPRPPRCRPRRWRCPSQCSGSLASRPPPSRGSGTAPIVAVPDASLADFKAVVWFRASVVTSRRLRLENETSSAMGPFRAGVLDAAVFEPVAPDGAVSAGVAVVPTASLRPARRRLRASQHSPRKREQGRGAPDCGGNDMDAANDGAPNRMRPNQSRREARGYCVVGFIRRLLPAYDSRLRKERPPIPRSRDDISLFSVTKFPHCLKDPAER